LTVFVVELGRIYSVFITIPAKQSNLSYNHNYLEGQQLMSVSDTGEITLV